MRLWHKDLISVLPRKQLVAQWRECCSIASNIANKGTPNHALVNKVLEYPASHFLMYADAIIAEMKNRNYKVSQITYTRFLYHIERACDIGYLSPIINYVPGEINEIYFEDWHNIRYLIQCYYNLQEKYDCGIINENEWKLIENRFKEITNNYSCIME